MKLLPQGALSALLSFGLLPISFGQLRWLLVFLAKIPARFSPQRPKPQACAAPTEEAQARVNPAPRTHWPLALGQAGEYFQLQSLAEQRVCLSLCPPLSKPLRQGLNHDGVLFRVLLLNSSLRKNPLCRQRLEAGKARKSAPLPSCQGGLLRGGRVLGALSSSPSVSFLQGVATKTLLHS